MESFLGAGIGGLFLAAWALTNYSTMLSVSPARVSVKTRFAWPRGLATTS
jgi:hypothetical protein